MTQDELPGTSPKKRKNTSRGPIYQGVCQQIRALTRPKTGEPLVDENLWAGTIKQARQLAASIDRADGSDGTGHQANGVPLAAMHQQLDALLARLNPEANDTNPMAVLVEQFQREEAEQRARAAQASHPTE